MNGRERCQGSTAGGSGPWRAPFGVLAALLLRLEGGEMPSSHCRRRCGRECRGVIISVIVAVVFLSCFPQLSFIGRELSVQAFTLRSSGNHPKVESNCNGVLSACEKASRWLVATEHLVPWIEAGRHFERAFRSSQEPHQENFAGNVMSFSTASSALEKGGEWQSCLQMLYDMAATYRSLGMCSA